MGNNHKTNNKYQGKMKFTTKTLALLMAAAVTVSCSGDGSRKNQIVPLDIDSNMTEAEIRAGILTPEVMWKMGRVGESVLSPDGKSVVYSVTWYNMQENRGLSHLYLMPSEGGEPQQLTVDAVYDHSPQWSADGKTIYFLSDRTGEGQIWAIGTNGKRIHQVSDIKGGIEGFGIAPKGDHFYYVQNVHVADIESKDVYPDLDKSKGLIYNDLMTRHWDYWDRGYYKHVFVGKFDGKEAHAGKDIMPGEAWDAPLAPYFDMKEISWNNAGTQLAYTCKKMTGTKYAQSTDSDIFVYDVAKGTVTNINKAGTPDDPRLKIAPAFPGYDKYPVFSPDDRYIAFQSMRRPGNESDKDRLFVWDSTDGSFRDLTEAFDYNSYNLVWKDNGTILFLSPIEATRQLCSVNVEGIPAVEVITRGDHDITAFTYSNGVCVAEKVSISQGTEALPRGQRRPQPADLREQAHLRQREDGRSTETLDSDHRRQEDADMGDTSPRLRPEPEVPHPALLPGRPAGRGEPVLELPLELPAHGRPGLCGRSPEPPRRTFVRTGVARPDFG